MQPLALYPANSMFTEGYLTTGGQARGEDVAMLEEAGFFVETENGAPCVLEDGRGACHGETQFVS